MRDLKKLYRRDSLYWLCVSALLLLALCYIGFSYNREAVSQTKYIQKNMLEHPELPWEEGGPVGADILYGYLTSGSLNWCFLLLMVIALYAQAARLIVLDLTTNRRETAHLLPVKRRNRLTYDYLSGFILVAVSSILLALILQLVFAQVPRAFGNTLANVGVLWMMVVKNLLLFAIEYAEMLLAREITNHIPGAMFTFILLRLSFLPVCEYCFHFTVPELTDNTLSLWGVLAIWSALYILLAYIANRKRDDASSATYAFRSVHWIMMAIVLALTFAMFHYAMAEIPKIAAYLLQTLLALSVTAGVHYLTRPKKI